jgi:hypothetical protein
MQPCSESTYKLPAGSRRCPRYLFPHHRPSCPQLSSTSSRIQPKQFLIFTQLPFTCVLHVGLTAGSFGNSYSSLSGHPDRGQEPFAHARPTCRHWRPHVAARPKRAWIFHPRVHGQGRTARKGPGERGRSGEHNTSHYLYPEGACILHPYAIHIISAMTYYISCLASRRCMHTYCTQLLSCYLHTIVHKTRSDTSCCGRTCAASVVCTFSWLC